MNYIGDYQNDKIYGTSGNRKIKVTTADAANFLLCEVTVEFDGAIWNHSFEVPFYNDLAEFYFESYVHSIIIQEFSESSVTMLEPSIFSFDLAKVTVVLKEMKQSEELSQQQIIFYMTLGSSDVLDYNDIESGKKYLVETINSKYITDQALLSFSVLSLDQPSNIVTTINGSESQINAPTNGQNLRMHTLFIPVGSLGSLDTSFELSIKYADGTLFQLGNYIIVDSGPDHENVFYQNDMGTLSVIEFTGNKSKINEYKVVNTLNTKNQSTSSRTSNIRLNNLISLNTGFILDENKYEMILELLRSYNVFYQLDSNLKRMVVKGNPRIRPYITDENLKDETLTFKVSENDNILYRGF